MSRYIQMGNQYSFVSVIIPCRNEERYISNVLLDITNQDYPQEYIEIIVVDGMSDDSTKEQILDFQKKANVTLIENVKKITPVALNLGLRKAKGDVIMRIDAHCRYPKNYIRYLVENLFKLSADNVGVAAIAQPVNNTLKAKAIAKAISSVFGIGDSYFRTGVNTAIEMDSVPFGCYKREVFEEIGNFDEELIRNQDDEFNARLKKNNGKIWLLPDIQLKYYSRDSISKVAKMFYQYGFFKPLVNKKVGSPATIRQFVPPLFTLANVVTLALLLPFFSSLGLFAFLLVWIPYLTLNLFFSIKISIKEKQLLLTPLIVLIFIVIHLSYGYGYLKGWLRFQLLNKKIPQQDYITNR